MYKGTSNVFMDPQVMLRIDIEVAILQKYK